MPVVYTSHNIQHYNQGCRGYGYPWIYPWIYPSVDIRLRQYPWIFMDTYGYFYVTALELATSQNHNKTKQNRLFVGQLVQLSCRPTLQTFYCSFLTHN